MDPYTPTQRNNMNIYTAEKSQYWIEINSESYYLMLHFGRIFITIEK